MFVFRFPLDSIYIYIYIFIYILCSWICRTIFHNADFMILDTDAGLGFATNVGGRLDLSANAWTAIASCFRCFSC